MGQYLASLASVRFENFYLFPGDQPLLVVVAFGAAPFRLEFSTNREMTDVTGVKLTTYKVVTHRFNEGTLADPKMIDRTIVNVDKEGACWTSLPPRN